MSSSDVAATATAPSGQKTEPRRAFVLAGALAIAAGALGIVSFAGSNIKNNGSSKQAAAVEVEGLETSKSKATNLLALEYALTEMTSVMLMISLDMSILGTMWAIPLIAEDFALNVLETVRT